VNHSFPRAHGAAARALINRRGTSRRELTGAALVAVAAPNLPLEIGHGHGHGDG